VRVLYLAVIVVFVAAMIVFAFQNTQIVSVSFFGFAVSTPLAILVIVAYVLGAATGGSLFALLRWSFQGSRRLPSPRP
jgi:lipopolysaccharide assembly protein A